MAAYSTPGVYVEEISTLPPSIVQVSTAIPAFLGCTEKASNNGVANSLNLVPTRISNMLEFKQYFGGPQQAKFAITYSDSAPRTVKATPPVHKLYYTLDLYFRNGGSSCYIVSVGGFDTDKTATKTVENFSGGLTALAVEEEPTLLVISEAADLDANEYYGLCQEALKHCSGFKNRFCILDVPQPAAGVTLEAAFKSFRDKMTTYLKYGAAYFPHLLTSLSYEFTDKNVTFVDTRKGGSGTNLNGKDLSAFLTTDTGLYNAVKLELASPQYSVVLPSSAAIAGVYAAVDAERGVWKAPANVALNAVIAPTVKITTKAQDEMNIDATTGKSINAIRAFSGKGIVVWGARTLAGNDNEWRYISVRRLFSMIEDSAMKATFFAVFEPNDATTWLKVKSMIESFLYSLWQQGALAGPTPQAAYFVKVGLGSTMTSQDILEGRMIVEIGVAASRPAEFIILRFSHKLQEA
jgi:phage tail sheath protein FI